MLKDYTMTPNRAGIPVWRPAQPVIGKEDEHQTALTNWTRMMRTQYPALQLYHHIPNGGLRDKRTAARLIGQGVHSGVPDVFIPAARGDYHGIYVELKTGANNPTPNQNEFMSGAMAEGYYCAVCYGWPCAAAVIEDYLHMGAIPAADAAPVVHGQWIGIDSSFWKPTHSSDIPVFRKTYRCSECRRRTAIAENYCPNCGAQMAKEATDA